MGDEPIKLAVVRAAPVEELIAQLEELLNDARNGRLRSVVWVAFETDGPAASGSSGEVLTSAEVLGACQQMGLDYYNRRKSRGEF